MNPANRREEDLLIWPPPEDDLESIEILELPRPEADGREADAGPSPVAPAARQHHPAPDAAPAPRGAEPPSPPILSDPEPWSGAHGHPAPPPQAVIEVLELDALDGAESYVIDVRPAASSPDAVEVPVTAAGESVPAAGEQRGAPGSAGADAVAAPDLSDLSPVELPGRIAAPAAPDLVWPPQAADLDAIHVLDLGASAPAWPAGGVAPVGPSPLADASGTTESVWIDVPAAAPAPGATAVEAFGGGGVPTPVLQGDRGSAADGEEPWRALADAGADSADAALSGEFDRAEAQPRRWGAGRIIAWTAACAVLVAAIWLAVSRAGRDVGPPADSSSAGPGVTEQRATEGSAKPAATGRDVEAVADAGLDEARRALSAGNRLRAMDLAEAYLRRHASDPAALQLVEEILGPMRAEAARARRLAMGRAGAEGASTELAAAARRESAAVAAWRAGEYGRALRGLIDAESAFARVPAAATGDAGVAAAAPPAATAGVAGVDTLREDPASQASAAAPPAVATPAAATPSATAAAAPTSPAEGAAPPTAEIMAPFSTTDAAVRRVLEAYRNAYEALDARAAAAVYPAVDARALARAFSGLNSQTLEFGRCEVTPIGGDRARATCDGRAAFVPKVGSQTPRMEPRRWTFTLQRDGEAWRILQAQVSPR